MHLSFPSRTETSVPTLVALALGLALSAMPASAREHLGPYNNLLLKNPHPDAAGKQYGRGLAAGDFDGDGTSDLVVSEAGGDRLRVLRGLAFAVGSNPLLQFLSTTINMPVHSYTMASGDFDGDGRDEIAVSAMNASAGGQAAAGKVMIINRLGNGTYEVQSTIQAGDTYPGSPQASANLGNSLAAGDFDNDGFTDLAIGIRGQIVGAVANAGAVMIVYGSVAGIQPDRARIFNRNTDGLSFNPGSDDFYGWSLAAGDFDADGNDDLAIGIRNGTCPNGTDRGGAVVVLQGSASGVSNANARIWRPGVLGIGGNCATAGNFGASLATGEFGDRGFLETNYADLAIGAPATDGDQGAVHVIHGSSTGLVSTGNRFIAPPSLPGVVSGNGRFGNVVKTGRLAHACVNLDCDGDSLAVAAPFATINGAANAGMVWIFDSGSDDQGLLLTTPQPILPLPPLKIAGPHENDQFGNDMAIGDFNDDGRADLAIGAYLYDDGVDADSGAVQVLYQSELLFRDGFD